MVSHTMRKLFKRVEAEITIKEIFLNEISPFSVETLFRDSSLVFYMKGISHDKGEQIEQKPND